MDTKTDAIGTYLASITNNDQLSQSEDLQADAIDGLGVSIDVWMGLYTDSSDNYYWADGTTADDSYIDSKILVDSSDNSAMGCAEMNSGSATWAIRPCDNKEYCLLCNFPKYYNDSDNNNNLTNSELQSLLHKLSFGITEGSEGVFYIGHNYSYSNGYTCLSDFIEYAGFYDDNSNYTLYLNFSYEKCDDETSTDTNGRMAHASLVKQEIIILTRNNTDSLKINNLKFDSYDRIFISATAGSVENYTLGNDESCEYVTFTIIDEDTHSVSYDTATSMDQDCPLQVTLQQTSSPTQYPTQFPAKFPSQFPTPIPTEGGDISSTDDNDGTTSTQMGSNDVSTSSSISSSNTGVVTRFNSSISSKLDDSDSDSDGSGNEAKEDNDELTMILLTIIAILVLYMLVIFGVACRIHNGYLKGRNVKSKRNIKNVNNNLKIDNNNNNKNASNDHHVTKGGPMSDTASTASTGSANTSSNVHRNNIHKNGDGNLHLNANVLNKYEMAMNLAKQHSVDETKSHNSHNSHHSNHSHHSNISMKSNKTNRTRKHSRSSPNSGTTPISTGVASISPKLLPHAIPKLSFASHSRSRSKHGATNSTGGGMKIGEESLLQSMTNANESVSPHIRAVVPSPSISGRPFTHDHDNDTEHSTSVHISLGSKSKSGGGGNSNINYKSKVVMEKRNIIGIINDHDSDVQFNGYDNKGNNNNNFNHKRDDSYIRNVEKKREEYKQERKQAMINSSAIVQDHIVALKVNEDEVLEHIKTEMGNNKQEDSIQM